MKQTYFLDTSVIIEYLRNNKKVITYLDDFPGYLVSSYVVKAELYEGVFSSKSKDENMKSLDIFFDGLIEIFQVDDGISLTFGKVRSNLRKKGEIIEDFDILIAATCLENNLPLITLNKKHFDRIDGLKIISPNV